MKEFAYATITGNDKAPKLNGKAKFFRNFKSGIWIEVEVNGLPDTSSPIDSDFYGFHIHETGNCEKPFDKTGGHFNPFNVPHPYHAGDLPPLLGNNGYAYSLFYTNRLNSDNIIGKSIIIHDSYDDFTSQPAGNSGEKIGCGIIEHLK